MCGRIEFLGNSSNRRSTPDPWDRQIRSSLYTIYTLMISWSRNSKLKTYKCTGTSVAAFDESRFGWCIPQIGWITPDRLFYTTVPRPERVGSKKKGRSMPKSQPVVRLDFDFIQQPIEKPAAGDLRSDRSPINDPGSIWSPSKLFQNLFKTLSKGFENLFENFSFYRWVTIYIARPFRL